jgi:putative N6-adenine-specific DNA methylase
MILPVSLFLQPEGFFMKKLFAVCARGLEPFTLQELRALGFQGGTPLSAAASEAKDEDRGGGGGVEFQGALGDVYRANLHLRTASRVFIQLGGFFGDTFSDLRRRARRLPWEEYLKPGEPVSLRISCHRSRLFHSGAVSENIIEAMGGRLGQIPPVRSLGGEGGKSIPQLIFIRLLENRFTFWVDSSGTLLHRRGYRLATAKAPLRETLASAMLMAAAWNKAAPLLDPFCGSGTIAIEAALRARNIPPGSSRPFAFMHWPNFDRILWEAILEEGKKKKRDRQLTIMASDRDQGAIQAASANAARAGVAEDINFSCRAISGIKPPPGPGWIVTNPPYGVRLRSKQDLGRLYARFGSVLAGKCPGWKVVLLVSNRQLWRNAGLQFDRGVPLRNGGLKVNLVKAVVRYSNLAI